MIMDVSIDIRVATSLAIGVICGFLLWIQKRKWSRLPPGPFGLPIVGYIPFLSRKSFLDFIRISKIYKSNIISMRLGSDLAVM